jgi:L-ascorbate metabolism protein UlaG (beta-lactamase superfamily)
MAQTRRSFLQSGAHASLGLLLPGVLADQARTEAVDAVRIRLIRHATCVIRYGGQTILLDPMLSDPGVMPAIARTPNPRPNPLLPLPMPAAELIAGVDATMVTHTHFDHWDVPARDVLSKRATVFIQPADTKRLADAQFTDVRAVDSTTSWNGITIARTGGQHGRGENAQRMGPVSGFVLSRIGSPTVYIAGDTVWCPEVADAIRTHKPNVVVVNAGAAQFLEGGPITMDVEDVVNVCQAAPQATVVAVHMEAINHCVLTRDALRTAVSAAVKSTVLIPHDGEDLRIA